MTEPNFERGFTLVELAVTVLVLGILLAFSVPAFSNLSASYQLKGTTQAIAGQLRLAREKAIATGVTQPVHIVTATTYHIHYPSGTIGGAWTTPRGITIVSPLATFYRMGKDGRCDNSTKIIVRDRRGNRDTVSVQLSGLVTTE